MKNSRFDLRENNGVPLWKEASQIFVTVFLGVLLLLSFLGRTTVMPEELSFSEFEQLVVNDAVDTIVFTQHRSLVTGEATIDDELVEYTFRFPNETEPQVVDMLVANSADFTTKPPPPIPVTEYIWSLIPVILLGGLVVWMMSKSGMGGKISAFTKSKKALSDVPKSGFDDIGGLDTAVEEVAEVVEFLTSPASFSRLGAKVPAGVMMVGPPGTGKTALARAAAGEASVPFYSMSGSEFVEMFVGVGAARVRALFEEAQKTAPAVVFIDEIDALGRQRGAGLGGGNDEREQTLNELLVQLDGFAGRTDVVVFAATNRPDVLDPALLRRFGRTIHVDRPDKVGREQILKIHAKDIVLGDDVDLLQIAGTTLGFSGADLENLLNESALFAVRAKRDAVTMIDIEAALDRVTLGAEKRTSVVLESDKEVTAYHEAGHTLVAFLADGARKPNRVSIVPRGGAGGVTHMTPPESVYTTVSEANAFLTVAMAGRAAEAVLLGDNVTSGGSHDFKAATDMATDMVTKYGMSDAGPVFLASEGGSPFLGRTMADGSSSKLSPTQMANVEQLTKGLLDDAMDRAKQLIDNNSAALRALVATLLVEETLNADRIAEVIESAVSENQAA